MPLLEVEDLHVAYGDLEVVRGISLAIAPGEIVTVLGSNGAGKTTTLKCIAGLLRVDRGRLAFDGRSIVGTPPHEIADRGLALVPEGRQLFPEHTVRENLELGGYRQLRRRRRREFDEGMAEVLELFPRVRERLDQPAGLLSGGEQQMVAIGRALVSRPRLLLLDEPSLGLAPLMVEEVMRLIRTFRDAGMTVLLVEQNANLALRLADRAYVMETGAITLTGTGAQLLADERVRRSYLGAKAR